MQTKQQACGYKCKFLQPSVLQEGDTLRMVWSFSQALPLP